ncbi:MAG: sce7726 family protein [Lachnospiraceae bacterium]|nr:sce7726 family protein [Lachnospiraceae bacterium]
MLDKDIREPLFDFLEEFYGKIRIFEEKVTGISRTDALGVIDGQLIGFEIKSDRDTYARLKRQTADYDLLCDVNYLVVGKSHRKQADQHIPAHWGIICVYEEEKLPQKEKKRIIVEIDQIPGVNPNVKIERQLDLLWRPELATLQEWNEMPKYAQKSKAFVREKILERVPQETLKHQITDLLFERDYEALLAQIREVQKKTRPRKRKMSKKRSVVKAVRKKRRAAAK